MHHKLNRRRFLGQASCASIGSITTLNTLFNLWATNNLAVASSTPPTDYKALVCILLAGGNDSYNMLIPRGNSEYMEYATTRSNLAIPQEQIISLNHDNIGGKLLGVHPSMTEVAALFEQEDLAFISNVGTLVEPLANVTEYRSSDKRKPLGLFSHSDQIEQWQTSLPDERNAFGWGGRMADLLNATNNTGISMNISLSGRNVFQSGQNVLEYSISNRGNGTSGIEQLRTSEAGVLNRLRNNAVDSLMADIYGNVFKETFANLTANSLESQKIFEASMEQVGLFPTIFSDDDPRLSLDLRMIARVISAAQSLDQNRQIFFTTFGGWDHHNEVLNNQEVMLGIVSRAIDQFYRALDETDPTLRDKVTLFTVSDFARTLTSNGNGSDHAWGGNMMVAGGAVKGKKIYGTYPDLDLENDLIISPRGNLLPTTATDQVFAELARWFGVSETDLNDSVLPNFSRFDTNPMGFLL